MNTQAIITDLLGSGTLNIHKKRLTILSKAVASTLTNPKAICLTNIGRGLDSDAHLKHKIKSADRLIGNTHLYQARKSIYATLANKVLSGISQPIILVDWSPLSKDQEQQLLRAAIVLNGKRAIALYEQVHPISKLGNRKVQHQFLQVLKDDILPEDATPIIIGDSGFRVPFYAKVEQLGWHWVGRIRSRDHLAYEHDVNCFFDVKELHKKASKIPQNLGNILWTKTKQFKAQLFIYHKPSQGRIDKNLKGKRIKGYPSRKQAKRESEPWILVASRSLSRLSAKKAVLYYQTRMGIEMGFRDTKNHYYGLGLTNLSRIKSYRYENMLLIIALAMFVLWVIGNTINRQKALLRKLQVNTKNAPIYSVIFVARIVLQYSHFVLKKKDIIFTLKKLQTFYWELQHG